MFGDSDFCFGRYKKISSNKIRVFYTTQNGKSGYVTITPQTTTKTIRGSRVDLSLIARFAFAIDFSVREIK